MTYIPGGSEPRQEPLGQPAHRWPDPSAPEIGTYRPLPHPKKRRTGLLVGLIAAAVVVSIGATLITLTVVGIAPWSAKQQAIHVCEDAITAQLKSPTTAKYSNVQASSSPVGGYDVFGDVDAQNGFGAMIRNGWSCYASHQNGRWSTRASLS